MPVLEKAPAGAVESANQLRVLIRAGAPVWEVIGTWASCIYKHELAGASLSMTEGTGGITRLKSGEHIYLADINIGFHYNANYIFIREEDAIAYSQWCQTDEDFAAQVKAHHQELDEMEREWDKWPERDRYEEDYD